MAWRNEAPDTRLDDSRGRAQSQATTAYPDWDAIYTDNVGRIYRLLFAKVGNRPDAEDLTSQVFLAALGPLRTTASVGEVRAYLLSAARTVLAAHWRRTLGHQVTVIDPADIDLADLADPSGGAWPGTPRDQSRDPQQLGGHAHGGRSGQGNHDGPGQGHGTTSQDFDPRDYDDYEDYDDQEHLARHRADRILSALPDNQRRILTLRFLQGCSVKEAAAELGVTVANAKVLQHRALRRAAGLEQGSDKEGDTP